MREGARRASERCLQKKRLSADAREKQGKIMKSTKTALPAPWTHWLRRAMEDRQNTLGAEALDWLSENAQSDSEKRLLEMLARKTVNENLPAAELARVLLDCGADPKEIDCDFDDGTEKTALMAAAESGHADCVALLLPLSDAGAADEHGQTALMAAAKNENHECARLLIPQSDANARDFAGRTALSWAAEKKNGVECVKALMPASDFAVADNAGLDAFWWALEMGAIKCADALSPLVGSERLAEQLSRMPADAMPAAHARLEREALAAVEKKAGASAFEEPSLSAAERKPASRI